MSRSPTRMSLPRWEWGWSISRNSRVVDATIRGGTLVTVDGLRRADLAIEDGRILTIAPDLPGAREEIDAGGLIVLPGVIDAHLHFNEPGRTEWEGSGTGSRALAAG